MNKHTLIWVLLTALTACNPKTEQKDAKKDTSSRVAHLPYYKDESFTPYWLEPGSPEEKNFHKISGYSLIDQLGDTITPATFEGKIYITDFFFTTCPGICLKMTGNLQKVQEAFKDDPEVLLLSHSVTPSIDSVEVLKAYAEKNGIVNSKWHLVTGNKKEIYDLGRNQYFVENDLGIPKDINDFLHTENFLLIDKNQHIRGIYNGLNRSSVAQLITDIKALKEEM